MSEQEIFEEVKEIVVNQLGASEEQVTLDANFIDDLSADSLDIVEVVMSIEETFGIEVADDAAEKIVTVGDVVSYIKNNK